MRSFAIVLAMFLVSANIAHGQGYDNSAALPHINEVPRVGTWKGLMNVSAVELRIHQIQDGRISGRIIFDSLMSSSTYRNLHVETNFAGTINPDQTFSFVTDIGPLDKNHGSRFDLKFENGRVTGRCFPGETGSMYPYGVPVNWGPVGL